MRKKKRKELKEGGGKKRGREIGTVWVGVEAWVGEKGPGPGSAGNPKSKHQWVLVSLQRPDHAQSPHSFLLCSSRICCSALLDPFAVHCQDGCKWLSTRMAAFQRLGASSRLLRNAPSQLTQTRSFAADAHGPAKVPMWAAPGSPSTWKEEHFVFVSLAGWGALFYGGYKFFTSGSKKGAAEVVEQVKAGKH
ncbi:uncharacterized protein [Physcomitrium patens]|uniref:Uncharacterized protein n=1 Tax=Physcomitrium patens TaxID=3218 RepID=A0A2K1KF07_PHYPA|nr:hypothetical protein PHYPA_008732 [Physcomitrium patens]